MRVVPILLGLCLLGAAPIAAQPPASKSETAESDATSAREAGGKPYRYPMPAVAETVRDLQHSAQAMLLREYCADKRIPDEFVDQRLAEFSRMTGREENCRTLLEY